MRRRFLKVLSWTCKKKKKKDGRMEWRYKYGGNLNKHVSVGACPEDKAAFGCRVWLVLRLPRGSATTGLPHPSPLSRPVLLGPGLWQRAMLLLLLKLLSLTQ